MPGTALIAVAHPVVAAYLAAGYLVSTDDDVLVWRPDRDPAVDGLPALVAHAVAGRFPDSDAGEGRVRYAVGAAVDAGLAAGGRFTGAWYGCGGFGDPPAVARRFADETARTLLPTLASGAVADLVEVTPDGPDPATAPAGITEPVEAAAGGRVPAGERPTRETAGAAGGRPRRVVLAEVVGDVPPVPGLAHHGILRFLRTLHEVRAEVEGRDPGYFRNRPLRCRAAPDAPVRLVPAHRVPPLVARSAPPAVSGGDGVDGSPVPAVSLSFAGLCRRVGEVYDMRVVPVDDDRPLTPVDRYFARRLGPDPIPHPGGAAFPPHPGDAAASGGATPDDDAPDDDAPVDDAPDDAPGDAPGDDAAAPDDAELGALLRGCRRSWDAADRADRARAADAPRRLAVRDAGGLRYRAGGRGGEPLVLLNALGQGLAPWSRLIDRLLRRHRLLTWEPRGLDPDRPPSTLSGHVDDLAAVLDAEGVDRCHLVGWCTGAKVAVRYHHKRPDRIGSMILLNGAFKHDGWDPALDSDYERNIAAVCRSLDRNPDGAARALALFAGDGTAVDPSTLPGGVLALPHRDLAPELRRPYRSAGTLLRYARQLLDFWRYDATAGAAEVGAACLFVAAEYDRVSSPAGVRYAAGQFPTARYVEVGGATHYCLLDRAELIADLIEEQVARAGR